MKKGTKNWVGVLKNRFQPGENHESQKRILELKNII